MMQPHLPSSRRVLKSSRKQGTDIVEPITTQPAYTFHQGTRPLLVSMPHVGTYVPPAIAARLTDEARHVPDTDWHLPLLYEFALALGASVLVATHSRYVMDVNRPPDNTNLYPGQNTTGLCPIDTFDSTPVYLQGEEPGEAEIASRRDAIWTPYHQKLEQELARLKSMHGQVGLWDAHSIRSVLPRFFVGKLPDFNFGTADGASCEPGLAESLLRIGNASGFTSVLNGRFKGGHITRQYGKPELGIQAIQLEMTQCIYMQERLPFDYAPELAVRVQPHLKRMLETVLAFVASKPG
jgi:N-formylglutamate deformylase